MRGAISLPSAGNPKNEILTGPPRSTDTESVFSSCCVIVAPASKGVACRKQRQEVVDAKLLRQGRLAPTDRLAALLQRFAKPRQAISRAGQELERRFTRQRSHRIR